MELGTKGSVGNVINLDKITQSHADHLFLNYGDPQFRCLDLESTQNLDLHCVFIMSFDHGNRM